MTRETAGAKARRYLVEQRVTVVRVVDDVIDAVVQGDTGEHHVGRDPARGWHCTCLAHGRCSHVAELKLVTTRPRAGGEAA